MNSCRNKIITVCNLQPMFWPWVPIFIICTFRPLGTVNENLIEPFVLTDWMDDHQYLEFFRNELAIFIENVPLAVPYWRAPV